MQIDQALREVFGFDGFRDGQGEIVECVARGDQALAIMPTGGGKSLCYQLPALVREGVTVVISPLIALMRDQVRSLQELGVVAGALTSGNSECENQAVWDALRDGTLKLLYLAPERLAMSGTAAMLKGANVQMIAVDEAHCVSQWGHDFRPDYLRIGELKRVLNVPISAFTATADEETRAEISSKLFAGDEPQVFLRGFDRPNIHLSFVVKDRPRAQILQFAAARKGQAGIVYCGTRAKTQSLCAALYEAGHEACYYHGGMEASARRQIEERFQKEDGLIVVATIAFGMGIDKPDIRWVAHADLPKSIEAYYQEIGRAGRDGAPAETLTLFGADDIRYRRQQIDESPAPEERRVADHGRLNALLGLCDALSCRRNVLLKYFGEELSVDCGHCDVCDTPVQTFDATTPVRMALSAALRTQESYGSGHLIDILRGLKTSKVLERGHDALPTFGVGASYNKRQWQAIFRQMMGHDLLRPDPSRHGGLRMTQHARPILRDEKEIELRLDRVEAAASPAPRRRVLVSDDDAPLLSALKAKRRSLADQANIPPYIVFNDATLIDMTQKRPQSLDDMMLVSGVGARKLARYGEDFLSVILREKVGLHPARKKVAGLERGAVYDHLLKAQHLLYRGDDGAQKPMSVNAGQLAQIAQMTRADRSWLTRILGERQAERFGDAFLDILREVC